MWASNAAQESRVKIGILEKGRAGASPLSARASKHWIQFRQARIVAEGHALNIFGIFRLNIIEKY